MERIAQNSNLIKKSVQARLKAHLVRPKVFRKAGNNT
jgi:hypothetical protein